jgi:hypothetical protein
MFSPSAIEDIALHGAVALRLPPRLSNIANADV